MKNFETVGARIMRLRKERDWSRVYVAIKIGVNETSIQRYERDEMGLRHEQVIPLAELFGVSIDYLLTGEESQHASVPVVGVVGRPATSPFNTVPLLKDAFSSLAAAYYVSDNSFAPTFVDGQFVITAPVVPGTLRDGDIIVATGFWRPPTKSSMVCVVSERGSDTYVNAINSDEVFPMDEFIADFEINGLVTTGMMNFATPKTAKGNAARRARHRAQK